MIRSPIGLRIQARPDHSLRDQIRQAAQPGAKGIVLDATGDLAPDRLGETGRRELRYLLRSMELSLIALNLPTRRPFHTLDQLDDRLARADRAFALAFELGTRLVLARVGGVPEESDTTRLDIFSGALRELGRRAEHRGVRLAIETGAEPGSVLRGFLDGLNVPTLAASIDPSALLAMGHDPITATRDLGPWVAHAYASDATGPSGRLPISGSRATGFPPGALNWEEYLGALEEIDYRGYLTIWPDPDLDVVPQFQAMKTRLDQF